jgi:hemerythrin-like metal-binding protein
VRYSEEYRLGHETLDVEHQLLFGLMTELETAIEAGHGQSALADVLRRVFMYAVMHFATEDRLMVESDYPDAHGHRAEHQAVLANLKQLEAELNGGVMSAPEDTLGFLTKWARGHIPNTDRRLADHLSRAAGRGSRPRLSGSSQ